MNHWAYVGVSKDLGNLSKTLLKLDIKESLESFLIDKCELSKSDIEQIFHSIRGKELIVKIRYFIIRYLYQLDPKVYNKSVLGRLFNRDHTSIIAAIKKGNEIFEVGAQGKYEERALEIYEIFNTTFLYYIKFKLKLQ